MRRRDVSKALFATAAGAAAVLPKLAPAQAGTAPYYAPTAAEIAAGLTINANYVHGNLLRYGIVPNLVGSATSNTAILHTLLDPLANNIAGLVFSPNTTGSDIYYFNDLIQVCDGVVLDFNDCQWNFSKAAVYGDDNNGFLFVMRDVTIQNGSLYFSITAGATQVNTVAGIFLGGRDSPVVGSTLPTIFDSLLTKPMGNITLRNLYINGKSSIAQATTGAYGICALGGLRNVRFENVEIEANSQLVTGCYHEFGFATSGPEHQAQSSHARDWHISNYTVSNLAAGESNGAFVSNGAYALTFDNVTASNCGCIISCSTGESAFLKPWVGVDDFGSLAQNELGTAAAGRWIVMRNIKGRGISGTGVSIFGATYPSGWNIYNSSGVTAWVPGTVYATNAMVYNGANGYTCTTGGTSSSAAGNTGPTGTGTGISDGSGGTTVWSYGVTIYGTLHTTIGGTGYNGWNHGYAYVADDVVINGQYIYKCTTGGTASAGQGPVGYGTGIADAGGGPTIWSSVPASPVDASPSGTAWPACTDQLNMSLDGYVCDSGAAGNVNSGYGVQSTCGITSIRNCKITNMSRGIATGQDCREVMIDGVTILNSGSVFGMQLGGPSTSIWVPRRYMTGHVKNCWVAGSSTGGVAPGYGIELAQCKGFIVENNRFGYELSRDGITETTQTYGVGLPVYTGVSPANGVVCRNNNFSLAAGAYAFYQYSVGVTNGNAIDRMLGPTQTYSGAWEGVLHSTTPIISADVPGTAAFTYTTQALDYVRKDGVVTCTFEIVTSAASVGSATGNLRITGLPYACNSSAVGSEPIGPLQFGGITKASYTNFNVASSGTLTYMTISASASGQPLATVQITDLTPTTGVVKLLGSFSYFCAP